MHKNKFLFVMLIIFFISNKISAASQLAIGNYVKENADTFSPLFLSKNTNSWLFITISDVPYAIYHSATCVKNTCIAIGKTNESENNSLLLVSHDEGQSWKRIHNILNFTETDFSLKDISCSSNCDCTIAGTYNKNNINYPLLLTSHDQGVSWSYDKNIFGDNPTQGTLSNITCAKNICIASSNMFYREFRSHDFPFLVVSNNNGYSWKKITNIPNLSNLQNPSISSAYCDNINCVAVGQYFENNISKPLILISTDGAQSWNLINCELSEGWLNAINCSGNNCVAVGETFILTSPNKGQSWSKIKSIDHLPSYAIEMSLLGAYCFQSNCIAIGNYRSARGNFPLFIASRDEGQSWSVVSTINDLPKATIFNINSFNCIDKTCTAVGFYKKTQNDNELPLLLESENIGQSWSAVKNIKKLPKIATGSFDILAK